MIRRVFFLLAAMVLSTTGLRAGEVTVAVAANFLTTAERLADAFTAESGHDVVLTHGSTGMLYAQARNGAPYDIFLAADADRPARLQADGLTEAVKPYALGKLVLISNVPVTLETIREDIEGRTVALADPRVAPYGHAALQVMESLSLDTAAFRPVLVTDVGQAASIFATGNADMAFVAASLLPLLQPRVAVSVDELHPPLRQDAVWLSRGADNPAAEAFWKFLDTDTARDIVAAAGYGLPE